MKTYNVRITVAELVRGENDEHAIQRLIHRLEDAGFHIHEDGPFAPNAFESDDQS